MLYKIKNEFINDYYYCDTEGNIYSLCRNKITQLKPDMDKDGYYRISLQCKNGARKSFRVNRLIAGTFLENPSQHPIVHHKNNNKQDNSVGNLEWVTVSTNTLEGYAARNYHYIKGIKATELDKILYFDSIKTCAEYYGIEYTTISKIANKKQAPTKKGRVANINFEFID